MIDRLIRILSTDRVALALARGAAMRNARSIDPKMPTTWEFCGFSQNGEDGITDYLLGSVRSPNRHFLEIGSASGLENNSSWLAIARRYSGLMVEANSAMARRLRSLRPIFGPGVSVVQMFVDQTNAREVVELCLHRDPDFFSLDIDGNDYYVMKALLDEGLRPKVIAVEYNSVFGPDRCTTITYRPDFVAREASPSGLYYGISIAGWKKFLTSRGYLFVTVEQNGVNAFFADPSALETDLLAEVRGLPFRENFAHLTRFRRSWPDQFELIKQMDFVEL
jgi:hypothetical protein